MARTFTIAQIKARARRRADMEHSRFVSDDELLDMINEAYAELYDLLIAAFQNYKVASDTITLVPGTTTYTVPSDFYKLISLDFSQGNGQWGTIFPYNENERNATLSTSSSIPSGTVRLRYVPAPEVFDDDSDTIDGVAGWESLLITDVAIMMLEKEESDTSALERRRQREYQRIQQMAQNRDISMPGRITDTTVYDNAYINGALRYRMYGDAFEFINVEYIGI